MTGKSMRKMIGTTRRSFLGQAGAGGLALVSGSAWVAPAGAETLVDLPLPEGPKACVVTTSFPEGGHDPATHAAPPFRRQFGVSTAACSPNDSFFVRWHWAVIPTEVDVNTIPPFRERAC
jgi:hypothetical protein